MVGTSSLLGVSNFIQFVRSFTSSQFISVLSLVDVTSDKGVKG